MDGIFLAYHNTCQLLGFEYISLKEIDQYLFGSSDFGEKSFQTIMRLLQYLTKFLVDQYPNQQLKILMCANEHPKVDMDIFVQAAGKQNHMDLFKLHVEVLLNGKKVTNLYHMDNNDQLSLLVSIRRQDKSQDEITIDYYNVINNTI